MDGLVRDWGIVERVSGLLNGSHNTKDAVITANPNQEFMEGINGRMLRDEAHLAGICGGSGSITRR